MTQPDSLQYPRLGMMFQQELCFTHLVEEGVGDVGSCDKCGPITCRLVQRTPRCFMSNLSCLSVIEAKMCP